VRFLPPSHFPSLRVSSLIVVGDRECTHALHGDILYPTTSSVAPAVSARASVDGLQITPSVSDPFGEIRTNLQETQTQSEFVLVVDPIHKQFEDRSIGWSVDQNWFVQWRPDDDSVPKPHHFMCVFFLVHLLIYRCQYAFTYYTYHFMWFSIIFYQLITCITSWDIYDCSL